MFSRWGSTQSAMAVLKEVTFKNIWVQPAAGDAGGSIGAALLVWHEYLANPRKQTKTRTLCKDLYLGDHFLIMISL